MNITIETPTKAYITEYSKQELEGLRKSLTYTNTSVMFLIKKHHKNRWWKQRNIVSWEERLEELQKQVKSCLLFKEGDRYWIRPGYIPYINQSVDVRSNISYKDFKPYVWKKVPEFNLYPYQRKTVDELKKIKHGNVSLPTGAGKSLCLLTATREMGLKTLIVTPSKSIFNELLNEFKLRLGDKLVGGYGDGKKDIKKPVTIAIGKSITMLKENTKEYNFFSQKEALLVDESHLFGAEELERSCHGVLKDIPVRFFVSGTQTRNDGSEVLLHNIIGKTVVEMEIEQAMQEGYLCPLQFRIVKTTTPNTDDITDPLQAKREYFLYNPRIAEIAAKIANSMAQNKKESTLILVSELRQIEMLKNLLNVPYAYVHSASKKQAAEFNLETVKLQDQVDKFNNGEVRVLIGTSCISTGTNLYPTHNVINWVGGGSEIVTKQGAMGRATRKLENSKFKDLHIPKPFSRIVDFSVINAPIMLEKQLQKRIGWYEETGAEVVYVN